MPILKSLFLIHSKVCCRNEVSSVHHREMHHCRFHDEPSWQRLEAFWVRGQNTVQRIPTDTRVCVCFCVINELIMHVSTEALNCFVTVINKLCWLFNHSCGSRFCCCFLNLNLRLRINSPLLCHWIAFVLVIFPSGCFVTHTFIFMSCILLNQGVL